MKVKSFESALKLFVFSALLVFFNIGCEKESSKEKFTEEGIKYEKFFDLAKGDTIPKGVFRDKPYVSPENQVTVLFSSEEYSSKATGNSTGSGYIEDLMTSVRDEDGAPAEMFGYTQIPVDLNEGAGGYWIYLYYKKTTDKVLALSYLNVRNNCCAQILFVSYPYMIKQGMRFSPGGLWTDLNNGAGGHYIKIEGCKGQSVTAYINSQGEQGLPVGWLPNDYGTPIKDVLIISSSSSLSSYQDWIFLPTDLNKGAGGKYIYLCYKKTTERK